MNRLTIAIIYRKIYVIRLDRYYSPYNKGGHDANQQMHTLQEQSSSKGISRWLYL